ncbi:MAG: TetR/AcrR family transcriptional regulator [Renibacterium salmoninarum]|nr:TetR/AcrR family transcriptional regulator [Renibacterium salmoninarum]
MARPRKFDHDATLDAIVDEFWGSSYAATSTEDLCARTGLSRSSLYNAFQSKPASYRLALV